MPSVWSVPRCTVKIKCVDQSAVAGVDVDKDDIKNDNVSFW